MRGGLAKEGFNHLRNGHTRRNRVGIHNHIRNKTVSCSRHILASYKHSNGSLLTVTIGELVSQLRNPILDDTNLHQAQPIVIHCHHHFLHTASCPDLRRHTRISIDATPCPQIPSNNHSLFIHIFTLLDDTTLIQLRIIQSRRHLGPPRHSRRIRNTRFRSLFLILFLKRLVGTEGHIPEHSTSNRIRIHHNAVILIVSSEASNRKNQIVAISNLSISHIVIIQGTTERCFTVTENVDLIVKPIGIVGGVNRQALFGLRAAELIAGRLIVVRERNHTGH